MIKDKFYFEEYARGRNDAIDGKLCENFASEAYEAGYDAGKDFLDMMKKQDNLDAVHAYVREHKDEILAKLRAARQDKDER